MLGFMWVLLLSLFGFFSEIIHELCVHGQKSLADISVMNEQIARDMAGADGIVSVELRSCDIVNLLWNLQKHPKWWLLVLKKIVMFVYQRVQRELPVLQALTQQRSNEQQMFIQLDLTSQRCSSFSVVLHRSAWYTACKQTQPLRKCTQEYRCVVEFSQVTEQLW